MEGHQLLEGIVVPEKEEVVIVGALEAIHHTGHVVGIARDRALVLARAQGVGETDPTHHMQGNLIGGAGNDPRRGQATANPTKNYCEDKNLDWFASSTMSSRHNAIMLSVFMGTPVN